MPSGFPPFNYSLWISTSEYPYLLYLMLVGLVITIQTTQLGFGVNLF